MRLKRNAFGGLMAPLPSGKMPLVFKKRKKPHIGYFTYAQWYGDDNPWTLWLEKYIEKGGEPYGHYNGA